MTSSEFFTHEQDKRSMFFVIHERIYRVCFCLVRVYAVPYLNGSSTICLRCDGEAVA